MTLPISYFRFYFPEYVLKTRLPTNCATGFLDSLNRTSESDVLLYLERATRLDSLPASHESPEAIRRSPAGPLILMRFAHGWR